MSNIQHWSEEAYLCRACGEKFMANDDTGHGYMDAAIGDGYMYCADCAPDARKTKKQDEADLADFCEQEGISPPRGRAS